MASRHLKVVHKQYNSPLGLYSAEAIAETLNRQTRLLPNGAVGIDFHLLAAPNLVHSQVYKMLSEEQRLPWQLPGADISGVKRVAWPPPSPNTNLENVGGNESADQDRQGNAHPKSKIPPPVPPKPGRNPQGPTTSSEELIDTNLIIDKPVKITKDWEQENMSRPEVPAPFASNELVGERPIIAKPPPPPGLVLHPLRTQAPISQAPAAIVTSQPVFKRSTPVRMLGDMVWPPKKAGQQQEEEIIDQYSGRVVRQQKDYRPFFSQNQLPANFPTYRAPPGTQHFGLEEGENFTPM